MVHKRMTIELHRKRCIRVVSYQDQRVCLAIGRRGDVSGVAYRAGHTSHFQTPKDRFRSRDDSRSGRKGTSRHREEDVRGSTWWDCCKAESIISAWQG